MRKGKKSSGNGIHPPRNTTGRKPRPEKVFTLPSHSVTRTVVALNAGAIVTVTRALPENMSTFCELEKTKMGTRIRAKQDLIMTITGNGARNSIFENILFCRLDEKAHGKKVFIPKGLTFNKYHIKTMQRSGQKSVHIIGGHTGALLYREECLVPDPSRKDHFWITKQRTLKQRANIIRSQSQQTSITA